MNIKEYIESGIIEACVLGVASEADNRELETLCVQYPEVTEARNAFEQALEQQLLVNTITPPAHVKENILRAINILPPAVSNIHQIKHQAIVRHINVWKYIAVASILLLAGTAFWAYQVNVNYKRLIQTNISVANQHDHSSHYSAVVALKSIIERPTVKWSMMVEPANASHCMAHIYWDSINKNTFLLLGNIPKPFFDKQFQLWAVYDNRPLNLGIFDIKNEGQLIQMKNIQAAKIFYITIEPRGGSVTPNRQATYAVGQL